MIDNRTANYSWPLPNPSNNLIDDVVRLIQAIVAIDGGVAANAALLAALGTASTKNVGTAVGNVVGVLPGGKIDPSVIPEIAIVRPQVVTSQAAMLALTAQFGDVAVRTDNSLSYMLGGTGDPTILSNWISFTFIDAVLSVAGLSGTITDVALRNALGVYVAATAAQYLSGAASVTMTPAAVWAAAGYVALVDAATIAVDLSTGINFKVVLGGNRTLGAPGNAKVGQSGTIEVKQDATGSRTLAYSTGWGVGASAPTLSTAANTRDLLRYEVLSDGKVDLYLSKGR